MFNEYNKFDQTIQSSSYQKVLCNTFLKLINPVGRTIFNINDLSGMKMLTILR